jgi:hypothetical protein
MTWLASALVRGLKVVLLVSFLMLVQGAGCATAGGPTPLYVSANGSDGASCTSSAPCRSFARAYARAKLGQTVLVRAGTYPKQTITDVPGKDGPNGPSVVFRPAGGAQVLLAGLDLGDSFSHPDAADHLTFVGFRNDPASSKCNWNVLPGANDITFDDVRVCNIYANGVRNYTVRRSDFGNCTVTVLNGRCDNFKLDGESHNVLIEGNTFHDIRTAPGSDAHLECFFLAGGANVTIRSNKFVNCSYFDLFIQYGSSPFSGLKIERNWFAPPRDGTGGLRDSALWFSGRGYTWHDVVVSHNSFQASTMIIDDTPSVSRFTVAGNILGSIGCFKGVDYVQNLWRGGRRCSPSDGATIPLGYALAKDRLGLDASDSALVREIFVRCADGQRPAAVASSLRAGGPRHLNAGLVRKVASNELYLGGQGGAVGASPALVSADRFRQAQPTCGH